MKDKICPPDKILNPKTNRCVLITGKIGQQILKELEKKSKRTKKPKEPKATKKPKTPKETKLNETVKTLLNEVKQKNNHIYFKNFNLSDLKNFHKELLTQVDEIKEYYYCNKYNKLYLRINNSFIIIAFLNKLDDNDEIEFKIAYFNDINNANKFFYIINDKTFNDFYNYIINSKIAKIMQHKDYDYD